MTKSTITKTWIGGLVMFAAGILVAALGVGLLLAYGGTFHQVTGNPNSYDFTPRIDGFFWTTITVMTLGGLFVLAGGIVQFVAWIGGLVNSYRLADRTWFVVLLTTGILSFFFALIGFGGMLAYVIAAPEGYAETKLPAAAPKLAPTT